MKIYNICLVCSNNLRSITDLRQVCGNCNIVYHKDNCNSNNIQSIYFNSRNYKNKIKEYPAAIILNYKFNYSELISSDWLILCTIDKILPYTNSFEENYKFFKKIMLLK